MEVKRFFTIIFLFVSLTILGIELQNSFAEEYNVIIPFGAYNPELNTPAEEWFSPTKLSIQVGDTITWINDDREGHTIASGKGSGRFGWMSDDYGTPDGHFESSRFMPNESWSFTFDKTGAFAYFCTIHPWMEGIVLVQDIIPDFPHDATGKRIEEFPLLAYTPDRKIEVNLTWEPNIIKTNEKIKFIYQFYDPVTNSNLAKMHYDFVIIQNGKEIYRDEGINQIGGDYRNFAFEESGSIIIRMVGIENPNILTQGSTTVTGMNLEKSVRTVEFSTIVYDNPDAALLEEFDIQPAQRLEFYYELAIAIILIPSVLFLIALFLMKKKPKLLKKPV